MTADSSWARLRSFRMKDTCSGVFDGVLPNGDAPGSADARTPVGTFSGVFGPGAERCAWAAPAVVAMASTPAASPIQRRERTERAMLGAHS